MFSAKDFKRPRDIKFDEKQGMFSKSAVGGGREMALPDEGGTLN
jgi:hypothetical protein